MDEDQGKPAVEPPRGMYPAKLDDKGRIKLGVQFQEYFNSLPEKKLFVTSFDRRTAQVYSIGEWRQVEKFFDEYKEDPAAAEKAWFNALDLGGEAEMDSQGRIVFPPELRRQLEIENQPVRIYAYKGHIEVLSERLYEERKRESSADAAATLKKLIGAGLR